MRLQKMFEICCRRPGKTEWREGWSFLEKHDTETNDGKDSSSPLGSFRGCNNQLSASIWPNHLHPLISSTDFFLLFLLGLLPASSNLSILLLIYSINVHPLYMPMHFHCYSLLPPPSPPNLNIIAPPAGVFPQTPSQTQSSLYRSAHLFFHSCWYSVIAHYTYHLSPPVSTCMYSTCFLSSHSFQHIALLRTGNHPPSFSLLLVDSPLNLGPSR